MLNKPAPPPPVRHEPHCAYWLDQYPWECTCRLKDAAPRVAELAAELTRRETTTKEPK